MGSRGVIFAAIVAGCLLLGAGWVVVAATREDTTTSTARVKLVDRGVESVARDRRASTGPATGLLVRAVDPSDTPLNGYVTQVSLEGGAQEAQVRPLACRRVHMSGGRGLCLMLAPSVLNYRARIFDERFRVRHELKLEGVPSRARVSPSGRWGAFTLFVTGHSYATDGGFSTSTKIVDMESGEPIGNLEEFKAYRGGERIEAPDFNYWGVTFAADDDRFYATLATAGQRYLVEGSISRRQVKVLRENVECPSLSPDETRIAYKKLVGGEGEWRLHVLNLRTKQDVILSETRSIDDQAEWLDRRTVLYSDGRDLWSARADGTGRPQRLLADADSPATLRRWVSR
jgi:hypothetical protein